ncbi:hypothetical protein PCAR4_220072 [Paraburkholderia caribensis]|nr:hypothetical protein PCAR4_220072 [Paraburkholderia caribensis]
MDVAVRRKRLLAACICSARRSPITSRGKPLRWRGTCSNRVAWKSGRSPEPVGLFQGVSAVEAPFFASRVLAASLIVGLCDLDVRLQTRVRQRKKVKRCPAKSTREFIIELIVVLGDRQLNRKKTGCHRKHFLQVKRVRNECLLVFRPHHNDAPLFRMVCH